MNILNDLIYFIYIGTDEDLVIKEMYKADPKLFQSHLNQIFDIEFRDLLAGLVGIEPTKNPESTQQEINAMFTEIAYHLHWMISSEGRNLWHQRGVTDEQIIEFQLGDNWAWNEELESFTSKRTFFPQLAETYNPTLVKQVTDALSDQVKTAEHFYGNGHALCIPSFDSQHVCRGLVFRNTHYKKNEHSLKNMFKFYNPFSWSYLFNYETFEKYDELIMVEGVFDALALKRAGYNNVISPSMVKLSPYHTRVLKDKKLHILFDGDRGGLEGLKFIKDKFGDETNLLTLALCPSEKDFDEMTQEEIMRYMDNVSHYDVRNMTSNPVGVHSIRKIA